jgi:hypothetical protein
MGFMDRMLEKSDLRVVTKVLAGLRIIANEVSCETTSVTCGENPVWKHVAIQVNFPDELGYFHRCRNTWHFSNNPDGYVYLPLTAVSKADLELATIQIATLIKSAL